MKTYVSILAVIILSFAPLTSAEDRGPNDLNTLLRDASYVFNRFEELSVGIEAQINRNYPDQIKQQSKELLSAVLGNVAKEKPALNALLAHSKVSSADLPDVYTELVEVTSELNNDSSYNWMDQKLGLDLAQLGANANVLSARLAVTLRSQIAAQELQLASCTQKVPSHK